jgi:hypothetical protein
MRYKINGIEVTRKDVQDQLNAEMEEAKNRSTFMGRIFYDLDYIERVATCFMKESNTTEFPFDNVVIIAQ